MAWKVELSEKAQENLDGLDAAVARRILAFLHECVATRRNPRDVGRALAGARLGSLWKYRVGDYLIIASIEDKTLIVLVVRIAHRREAYR